MINTVKILLYRFFVVIISVSLISPPIQAQTSHAVSPHSNAMDLPSVATQSTESTIDFMPTVLNDIPIDAFDEAKENIISYRQIDTWTLLPQEIKKHPSAGRIQIANIVVRVKHIHDDYTEFAHHIFYNPSLQETLNNSHLISEAPFYTEKKDFTPQIEMVYQGQSFWSLNKDIVTISRYGHYIVFITPDHIYKDHVQLSFIDLSYFQSTLGRKDGYPAIFQMPVPLDQPLQSMAIHNGLLKINDYEISTAMLDHFGYLQAVTWNVQANLLKTQSYEDMAPLIDSFLRSIESSKEFVMDMLSHTLTTQGQVQSFQSQLARSIESARNTIHKTKSEKNKEGITWKLTEDTSDKYFIENPNAQIRISNTLGLQVKARKMLGRMTLMFERLKSPQPIEGGTIRQALAFTLSSLKGPKGQRAWGIQEGVVRLIHNPSIQLGTVSSAVLLLGATYPQEAHQFVNQVISFGGTTVDFIFERFMAFYDTLKSAAQLAQSAVQVNGIFDPKQVWRAYIEEGDMYAFVIANTVLIMRILSFFAISHLTVNAFHLLTDLGKGQRLKNTHLYNNYNVFRQHHSPPIATLKALKSSISGGNIKTTIGAVKHDFIHRQNTSRQTYLTDQALSLLNSEKREFTQEETDEVIHILKKREKDDFLSKFLDKIKAPLNHLPFFQNKKITDITINNLKSSIMNLIFSWKSLENTFVSLTHIWWKHVFISTSYVFKPLTLMGLAYYPNALKTITHGGLQDQYTHPLTKANGGTRPFWREYPLLLARFVTQDTSYKSYQEWESLIMPIERQIMNRVQERAFRSTLLRIRDKQLHLRAYSTASLHEGIATFDKEQTRFYETVKGQLFERVFSKVITPLLEKRGCYAGDCLESLDQYKQETLEDIKTLNLSDASIEHAMNEVESNGFYQAVEAQLNQKHHINPIQNIIYKSLYKSLSSRNIIIKRWLITKEQMQDAGAKARATRKSFYNTIAQIPRLYIMWAAVSGIMLQSLHGTISSNDIMVPLTSQYPYYSQYVFGAGFFILVIFDIFRNFGLHLQREYDLKKEGVFNHIPEGVDTQLSFMRWFLRQMKDKNNTFLKNTMILFRMSWSNIPSYFVKFTIMYGLTLGRFPLDAYLTGYLLFYLFPINGFNWKIDHAMESAMSGYWMKYFPKHLRGHALVQNYALKKKDQYRAVFHFFFTFLYSNMLQGTIENFQMMGTHTSRHLSRMLFFGHPPTVWAVKAFNIIKESLSHLPFVGSAVDACESALTNGYDGWDPRVDGPPPDHIKPWISNNN